MHKDGGSGWRLVVGRRWRLVAVGGWQLVAVGSWWRLAVGGGWWLAVDGPLERSLRAVLNKNQNSSPLRTPWTGTGTGYGGADRDGPLPFSASMQILCSPPPAPKTSKVARGTKGWGTGAFSNPLFFASSHRGCICHPSAMYIRDEIVQVISHLGIHVYTWVTKEHM